MNTFDIVLSLFLVVQFIQIVSCQRSYSLGVMVAEVPGQDELSFCVKYYPGLYSFPEERSKAQVFSIKDLEYLEDANACDDENIPQDLSNKLALIHTEGNSTGNCSVAQRAQVLQEHNAGGMLADTPLSSQFNASEYSVSIGVAALYSSVDRDTLLHLKETEPEAKVLIYAPEATSRSFDASLLIILLMAVFTVAIGSIWSGYTKHSLRMRHEVTSLGHNNPASPGGQAENEDEERICAHGEGSHKGDQEEVSLRVSPLLVLIFVICMCTMLVALYFFFDKLVYVIIGMFCMASAIATYSCLEPVVMWTYEFFPSCPTLRLPKCNLYLCVINMELRQFLLLCFSIAITVVWAVNRNTEWAWILQDILGILFSLNMLKVLRLPSLKICTLLLSTLFIYDIFFVFITPLLTKDGKSVMVEVATGGSTGEQLPMVLRVPHLSSDPLGVCWSPYSMLGFGDILVPGLLLSFCHAFDLQTNNRCWTYWLTTNVAYTLGLVTTFISLYLMNSAQPALLYLVPFTLIPVFAVACIKGDLGAMWQGDFEPATTTNGQRESSADIIAEEEEVVGNSTQSNKEDDDKDHGE